MLTGLLSGIAWGFETVALALALSKAPFIKTEHAIAIAPFVATFVHDVFLCLWTTIYAIYKGKLRESLNLFIKTRDGKVVALSSFLCAPLATAGYSICLNYLGSSIGSAVSAINPAGGALLAMILLKEKLSKRQWLFLSFSILGVVILSYAPGQVIQNFLLGLLGVFMYTFFSNLDGCILAKAIKTNEVSNDNVIIIRSFASPISSAIFFVTILNGWPMVSNVLTNEENVLLLLVIAALFAAISFIFYFKSFEKIGVSKTVTINSIYVVWAMIITAIITGDYSVILAPITIIGSLMTVVFGVLTAVDLKSSKD